MPKGFFTQSVFVLLERAVSAEELEAALDGCEIHGTVQFREENAEGEVVTEGTNWAGAEVLAMTLGTDPRGALLVDVLPERWPDAMGHSTAVDATDPSAGRTLESPRLFGALATGQFGPFVFPGALERAFEMGRAEDAALKHAIDAHKALLRLRATWALQASEGDRPVPDDYDPAKELRWMVDIAANLLEELPGALCYFNPNGEVLATHAEMEQALAHADENGQPPLELYANVRFIEISDLEGFGLVDLVGMWQLDVPDQEALFKKDRYDPREVAMFLRHASFVQMKGHAFGEGEQAGGPARRAWRALPERMAFVPAPRPVVRWIALDGTEDTLPEGVTAKPVLDEEPREGNGTEVA